MVSRNKRRRAWTSLHRNNLRNDYYDIEKLKNGPGGFYCECCGYPFKMKPRKMKPLVRRYARHVNKQRVKQQIKEELN